MYQEAIFIHCGNDYEMLLSDSNNMLKIFFLLLLSEQYKHQTDFFVWHIVTCFCEEQNVLSDILPLAAFNA